MQVGRFFSFITAIELNLQFFLNRQGSLNETASDTDAQQTPIIERVQKNLAAPDSPDVPQLEAEIDRLVYDLYGLTEEEIAVVEGKERSISP